jgi:hypothetical protein
MAEEQIKMAGFNDTNSISLRNTICLLGNFVKKKSPKAIASGLFL